MTETTLGDAARRPRRWLRRAAWLTAAALCLCAVLLGLALETRPRVTRAPDAAAARNALAAGDTLREFVTTGGKADDLTLSEGAVDAVMAAASRLLPGVDAAARPDGDAIAVDLSMGPPRLPVPLWLNLSLDVTASDHGLALRDVWLGRLPLPASLVEAAAVLGADRLLGAGLARQAMAGVVGIDSGDGAVTVRFGYDPAERREIIDRIRAALGSEERDRGPAYAALWWFDRGGDVGDLPRAGSALPYLRWGLERSDRIARRFPEASDRDLATSVFLALALYCGEPAIGAAFGVQLNPRMQGAENHCAGTRLGGREDLRRHFTVSAALYALSTGDAAFGVGELKELVDSGPGGSGFSFDDMAANLAGARFAAAFLAAPRSDWPAMLDRIKTEDDVLPALAGLPSGLTPEEFAARFGEVDSPAYQAMIAEIRARVARLPLEAGPAPAVSGRPGVAP